MDNKDELVDRLLKEDMEFKKSYKSHKDYESKIAKLDKKKQLKPEDEVEINRLKKLKLSLKDGMEKKLAERRAQGE